MALVQQLGDDSWYVICAALCHMALAFTIMQLYDFLIVSVHSFLIFLLNLVLINQTE